MEEGDIIVMASDGLFDNVSEQEMLSVMTNIDEGEGKCSASTLAEVAKSLLFLALERAHDTNFMSPFAVAYNQQRKVYEMPVTGGYVTAEQQRGPRDRGWEDAWNERMEC